MRRFCRLSRTPFASNRTVANAQAEARGGEGSEAEEDVAADGGVGKVCEGMGEILARELGEGATAEEAEAVLAQVSPRLARHTFSKVLAALALHCQRAMALTFQKFVQPYCAG